MSATHIKLADQANQKQAVPAGWIRLRIVKAIRFLLRQEAEEGVVRH